MPAVAGRVGAVLASALVVTIAVNVTRAVADPVPPCTPGDPSCVIIGVGGPAEPALPGTSNRGGDGGSAKPDPCQGDTGYPYLACSTLGYPGLAVCVPLFEKDQSSLTVADLNALLTSNGCPAAAANSVLATPAQLALRALAGFVLPNPSGHRSPSETLTYDGYPFTYVHLWLYFWTAASRWKTLSATARAGGNWATVTATPVSLSYAPGDGSTPVVCAGPGRPWTDADGNAAPAEGACGYRYERVTSQPLTATQTITWQLSWKGSNGSAGVFPDRSTSTSGQLQVMQIETVVVRR